MQASTLRLLSWLLSGVVGTGHAECGRHPCTGWRPAATPIGAGSLAGPADHGVTVSFEFGDRPVGREIRPYAHDQVRPDSHCQLLEGLE